jgi:hypothetical protein
MVASFVPSSCFLELSYMFEILRQDRLRNLSKCACTGL